MVKSSLEQFTLFIIEKQKTFKQFKNRNRVVKTQCQAKTSRLRFDFEASYPFLILSYLI